MVSRLSSLDGIRAIAILMVLGSHCSGTVGFPECVKPIWPYCFNGYLGVKIFFVLSGFLITYLLLTEEKDREGISLSDFYRRRSLRILPVYIVYLLTVWLVVYFFRLKVSNSAFLSAATFTTPLWGESHWILFHTWSLSIEEQFYIFWPFAMKFLSQFGRVFLATSIVAATPVVRLLVYAFGDRALIDYTLPTQGDALMFGCLMAIWRSGPLSEFILGAKLKIACIGVVYSVLVMAQLGIAGFFTVPFGNTCQSIAIALLINDSTRASGDSVYRILNSFVVIRLGLLSYSLYIWQQLFLYPGEVAWSALQVFPINLGMTFIVAWISFNTIESFFIRIKNRGSRSASSAVIVQSQVGAR